MSEKLDTESANSEMKQIGISVKAYKLAASESRIKSDACWVFPGNTYNY